MSVAVSTKTRVYFYCCFLSIGGLLFGYDFGLLTGLLLMPSFQKDMNLETDITNISLISTLMAGAFVGAIVSGPLADAIGRRALMAIGIIIFLAGNLLQVGANGIETFYGGRGVSGISLGESDQSEMSPKNMRGRLMSTHQFAIALGTALSNWLVYAFVSVSSSAGWRLIIGIQLIPAVICLIGLLFLIPQSPRHSIDKNRHSEALDTLTKTRGDGTETDTDVLMEFYEMKQNISFEHKLFKNKKYKRIFSKGYENNRKRLLLGMAAQIFQQLTGVNAILVFAPQIFQSTGLTGRNQALFANGLSGSISLLATIPAMIFIDRWGRRRTMIIGSIVLCICIGILALLSGIHDFTFDASTSILQEQTNPEDQLATATTYLFFFDDHGATIGFLIITYICVAVYSCTWGTLGWIYPAELYSQGIRAKALGISTAINWLFTYIVLQLTPIMLGKIYWRTYVIYAVLCFVIACIVYWFFPETNGKSLEEINLIFSGKFNFYDVDVHHPQTAAAALEQMELLQQKNKNIYQFPFTPERTFIHTNQHHHKRSLIPNYVVSSQPQYTIYN